MTGILRRPVVHVLIAAIILIAGGAIATALAPEVRGPVRATPTEVPVSETVVACPGLRSREGFTESTVSAATPPEVQGVPPGAAGSGVVRTLTKDEAKDKTLIALNSPGDKGQYIGRNGERDSVTGSADGSLAPGFSVTQTERTVDGQGRGLASTQCLPTGNDFWFVGPSTKTGDYAVLVLTNPESATAIVEIDIYGPAGPLDPLDASGVQVPARDSVELRLDELVPDKRVLALNVQVRVGRLSAAVTETDVFGREPRGTDWLPRAEPPATALVVPGVPAVNQGRDSRVELDIVSPGAAAVVSVNVVTPEGTFAPQGVDVVDVPAGGVESVDITEALRDEPAAIVLESDVPVTAGARVFMEDPAIFGDLMFLAASLPLEGPAVIPDNRTTKDLATRLVLSAPTGSATVSISAFAGESVPVEQLQIPGGSTHVITVKPQKLKRFGLVVTPEEGSGPVYAARMLDEEGPRGPLVTSFPLRTARLTAVVPVTVPDVVAGTVD